MKEPRRLKIKAYKLNIKEDVKEIGQNRCFSKYIFMFHNDAFVRSHEILYTYWGRTILDGSSTLKFSISNDRIEMDVLQTTSHDSSGDSLILLFNNEFGVRVGS